MGGGGVVGTVRCYNYLSRATTKTCQRAAAIQNKKSEAIMYKSAVWKAHLEPYKLLISWYSAWCWKSRVIDFWQGLMFRNLYEASKKCFCKYFLKEVYLLYSSVSWDWLMDASNLSWEQPVLGRFWIKLLVRGKWHVVLARCKLL